MKLYAVGMGVGAGELLTLRAVNIIEKCDMIIAANRLYDRLSGPDAVPLKLKKGSRLLSVELSEIAPLLEQHRAAGDIETVAVLVSGDVGFYSAARALCAKFPDCEPVSGISSLQYFTAKLGRSYDDVKTVSLHGRAGSIVPFVCYNAHTFALTGGENGAGKIVDDLVKSGLGAVRVTVGERLSSEKERIISGSAEELFGMAFESLSVVLIDNERVKRCGKKLCDEDFIRGGSPIIPMTKEVIRTLSLSYLDIRPQDTVIDIGAGTGSVSVEIARKAHEKTVYALEKNASALAVLEQNRAKFGAYNIEVISADAPDGLDVLPPFDKAFIGGSGGRLSEIVAALTAKNPKIRIAVTAVTLETLAEAQDCFRGQGFTFRVTCVNAAHAENCGRYSLMKAENPVYILVGGRADDDGK